MSSEAYPLVSENPLIQAAYETMRADGQSHSMAEMLATRSLPGIRTDATFMTKKPRRQNLPRSYYKNARKAGVVTDGKYYDGQMARYPGDPEAWVSGRGDIRSICKKNQWSVEGEVNYKCTPKQVPARIDTQPYAAAEDLVRKEVRKLGRIDPGLVDTPRSLEKTTEETRVRLAGNK
jgi:hypothetical protein